MQTLNATDTGRATDAGGLMAAWRATGGALDASAARPAAADDGLAAMAYSQPPYCYADDGLGATAYSNRWPQCADDGLAAMAYSRSAYCGDDELMAIAHSRNSPPYCIAE